MRDFPDPAGSAAPLWPQHGHYAPRADMAPGDAATHHHCPWAGGVRASPSLGSPKALALCEDGAVSCAEKASPDPKARSEITLKWII